MRSSRASTAHTLSILSSLSCSRRCCTYTPYTFTTKTLLGLYDESSYSPTQKPHLLPIMQSQEDRHASRGQVQRILLYGALSDAPPSPRCGLSPDCGGSPC
ncbi:hypothetical protein OH76DRAFT_1412925 [Lentinus brumalis]|uniref:Uncharacterized protein n=1 Tax=Lentinus brumalis TaxID=2498619 RepID=A0A371CJR5_9APHY|nr:hypothetical protein OH76DRAFT_1412925 [Polyporus brumalis]